MAQRHRGCDITRQLATAASAFSRQASCRCCHHRVTTNSIQGAPALQNKLNKPCVWMFAQSNRYSINGPSMSGLCCSLLDTICMQDVIYTGSYTPPNTLVNFHHKSMHTGNGKHHMDMQKPTPTPETSTTTTHPCHHKQQGGPFQAIARDKHTLDC